PETVVHDETGLLVEDDRPGSIAAALAAILGDPDRARRMGAAGRRRAEEAFDPARAIATIEAVYHRVTARPSPG
ncbi:MAG: glycosyltransferase family 4 protein, partial [Candidatus Rokuibacteriota bacterium]